MPRGKKFTAEQNVAYLQRQALHAEKKYQIARAVVAVPPTISSASLVIVIDDPARRSLS